MPRKGMRSICFNPRTMSTSIARDSISSLSFARISFAKTMIEQSIESAEALITKWDPDSSTYAKVTSMFHENKTEALLFIKRVNDLQKSMHSLVLQDTTSQHKLTHAQTLMQIAMKRLQKEFYQILSMNRAHLDPESVSTRSSRCSTRSSTSDFDDDGTPDEDDRVAGNSISEVEEVSSIAMDDLRSIAECMISSGYAKECLSVYKIIRKSIIDEGIYRLGVEQLSSSKINKMSWEVLELRINSWLEAVKIAMRTLFNGERILCDHVFAVSDPIRESCFAEISRESATLLFGFPELVAKSKKSPENIVRLLDMYTAIAENWPDIESIFSFESTSTVRLQALASLNRLAESVRTMLSEFESSIQKDSSKSLDSGGGVHALTLQTMDYLSPLGDYSNVLADILASWSPPEKSLLPESFFDSPDADESPGPVISLRMARLILVLLCKLDSKAKHYKNVAMSYLFLANNLQHVVTKIRKSNLQYILGEEWISKHEAKVRQFAANYERLAWGKVFSSLPGTPTAVISPAKARAVFKNFNSVFEEAYRKQRLGIVSDPKLRDEIKVSIARKLVPVYREFYNAHRIMAEAAPERGLGHNVRFAPEDIGHYLSDLFFGATGSGSTTPTSSSHRRRSGLFKRSLVIG